DVEVAANRCHYKWDLEGAGYAECRVAIGINDVVEDDVRRVGSNAREDAAGCRPSIEGPRDGRERRIADVLDVDVCGAVVEVDVAAGAAAWREQRSVQ